MSSLVLSLRDFTVRLGDRLILAGVDLDIGRREIMVLMGPGGGGKSTLLRTICGLNDGHNAIEIKGLCEYLGEPLGEGGQPVLIEQNPRMMSADVFTFLAEGYPDRSSYTRRELKIRLAGLLQSLGVGGFADRFDVELLSLSSVDRRLLMLAEAAIKNPALLCVDEPTVGLEDREAGRILKFLEAQKEERAVLMVTHNQRHGREISDYTALLAGGKIHEHLPTEEFFFNPQTEVAKSFIRTGSCTVASPNARPEELGAAYRDDPPFPRGNTPVDVPSLRPGVHNHERTKAAKSESRGPYGFHWMRPGKLAGTPMPGVVRSLQEDLKALKRVEVSLLITLTVEPLDAEALADAEIDNIHFPIGDMEAPSLEEATKLCELLDERLEDKDVIAFHCRAGIGRTGTMLAAYEIWDGMSARDAFDAARRVHSRWVQSRKQRQFLTEFERWLE